MAPAARAALAATALALPLAAAIPNLATTVLLSDYVESTGARCLDGTAPRYWIQRNPASTQWAVHFMGGGWCESTEACAGRAYSWECYIGSSNPECFGHTPGNSPPGEAFNTTMDFTDIPSCLGARWCGGLFVNDAQRNPLTADWNKVEIHYCSGDGHVGDQEAVTYVTYNGTSNLPLYYRGGRNAAAVFDSLMKTQGFDSATEVILSGDSAGGLATYSWADRLTAMLPAARVVAAPDSGFFFTQGAGYPAWNSSLYWVASNGNATRWLNDDCVAALTASGTDPLWCIFPETASKFIKTPLFIMNSRYDPALDGISGGQGQGNATWVNALGATLTSLVNATVLGANANAGINAAFITSCAVHCGQWGTNQTGYFPDYRPVIDGWSGIPALAYWYANLPASTWPQGSQGRLQALARESLGQVDAAPRRYWYQQAQFPCATCCQGGQS